MRVQHQAVVLDLERALTATAASDLRRLADELFREFGDTTPDSAIQACLVQAISDLKGSVTPDSLPEMALRLARVRLAARAEVHVGEQPNRGVRRPACPGRSALPSRGRFG